MKKLLLVSTLFLITFLPGQTYEPGDINGDLQTDMSDAVYLLRYLFQGGSPPKEQEIIFSETSQGKMSYPQAIEYCESRGYRLPTIKEMLTLADYDINPVTTLPEAQYWTQNECSHNSNLAWFIFARTGELSYFSKGSQAHVIGVKK